MSCVNIKNVVSLASSQRMPSLATEASTYPKVYLREAGVLLQCLQQRTSSNFTDEILLSHTSVSSLSSAIRKYSPEASRLLLCCRASASSRAPASPILFPCSFCQVSRHKKHCNAPYSNVQCSEGAVVAQCSRQCCCAAIIDVVTLRQKRQHPFIASLTLQNRHVRAG